MSSSITFSCAECCALPCECSRQRRAERAGGLTFSAGYPICTGCSAEITGPPVYIEGEPHCELCALEKLEEEEDDPS